MNSGPKDVSKPAQLSPEEDRKMRERIRVAFDEVTAAEARGDLVKRDKVLHKITNLKAILRIRQGSADLPGG